MKSAFKSVTEYIASKPKDVQVILKRVRSAIRKAVPAAEEAISYQIPAYKLNGAPVLYVAAWKQHYSLYPASNALVEAFKDELAPYKLSKGTIRLPLSEPVPVDLIERIAMFRAEQVTMPDKGKRGRKKGRETVAGVPSRFIAEMKLDQARNGEDPKERLKRLRAEMGAKAAASSAAAE